ncbi:MAG: hypothetical protein WD229_01120 [Pirellulales bacterium]
MEPASQSRILRAPQGDGEKLIEPPLPSLPEVVVQNRRQLAQIEYDVQGRSLADLSASARLALVERATAYTREYRDVPDRWRRSASTADVPFLLSGHQPQLFHPGVWYKNFVLGALGRRLNGVAVHLLIDSDLCRSASIRVPTGTLQQPRVEAVPYDQPTAEVPYEERGIRDFATLASFSVRVATLIRPLVREPLVESLWPLTLECNPEQSNLGLRLAQGRHALEATWHSETLELPQSAVCQLPEFAWFVAHVLAHLPRFWSAYNDALAAYRRSHRQRSRAHPVPDLAESDGWLEAPFWIWSADDPQRRPLLARQSGDEIVITDRQSRTIRLALSAERDATMAVEQLQDLSRRGIKIRTRALTTTLFARLVLSDLFLHGIGGAKYDQLTDQIAHKFFGFPLPEFAAVSATLRLPIARRHDERSDERSCIERLRELRFHPEQFIERNGPAAAEEFSRARDIIASKQHWIESGKTPENARSRHRAIAAANEALQPFVAHLRGQIERQCDEYQQRKRAEAILRSRDYAFCLYPRWHFEKLLRDLPNVDHISG